MLTVDKEFQELIPPLSDNDYQQLKDSLLREGCRDPICVWNNTIVDGHNRYAICTENNIPYKTKNVEFASRDEAKLWMIDVQLSRRNMELADKIILAQQKKPLLEKIAKERMRLGRTNTLASESRVLQLEKPSLASESDNPVDEIADILARAEAKLPEKRQKVHVQEEIAKLAGCGKGTVARFEAVQRQKPELVTEIRNQRMSINEAYNVVTKEKNQKGREERAEVIAEELAKPRTSSYIDIFTTENKYRIIYADPPWSYGDKQNIDGLGGAEKHYPTMPLEDICNLPVPALDNAVLFLWVTSPFLEDCFKVINAWGFKYKSSFVWDKVKHNMGHYNSVRHEFLLVCTKGSCTPDVQKLYDSVVSIERTDHSRKPKEFRDIIDTLYPTGNRLEMFAREAPDGWDVWGNMA